MEKFANFVQTTLAADITTVGQTAITVSSGTGFPDVEFRVRIDDEIVIVTSKGSGTNWTIVRGQEGTTAALHQSGASIYHVLTAGSLIEAPTAITRAGSTDSVWSVKQTADTYPRVEVVSSGHIKLGPGTGARDIELSRSAANTLRIEGHVQISNELSGSGPNLTVVGYGGIPRIGSRWSTDTYNRFEWNGDNDALQFGAGTSAVDVYIGRIAAGALKIASLTSADDALYLGDDIILYDIDSADRIGIKGQQDATAGGIVFGSGKDTNIYRSAANTLKTDDTFEAPKFGVGIQSGYKDITLSSQIEKDTTVTFGTTFTTTPIVVCTIDTSVTRAAVAKVKAGTVATTGFTITITNSNGNSMSGDFRVYWIATLTA